MRPSRLGALIGAAALLAVGGCSSAGSTGGGSAGGPITVEATDTACDISRDSAPAGAVEFRVHNGGSKVTEFYVYGDGDQIMGEVENITPGLTRTLHVDLSDPGTYVTACKPGMTGDGIRADFTVTGTATSPASDDAMADAVTRYEAFVSAQADELLARTTDFVDHVKAGDVEAAKAAYPVARAPWERIEPVAESFGDLDPRIDGREDVVAEGMEFTGFHRLEKDLWVDGLQPDSADIADRLLADVTTIVEKAKDVQLNPLQLANGAKGLLDEIATGKITGEEDRYSHTDLWDFDENVAGSKAAIDALRPVLRARDPELLGQIDARFEALEDELDRHRTDDGFVLYTTLGEGQVKRLSIRLDGVGESVSRVAGVVAGS